MSCFYFLCLFFSVGVWIYVAEWQFLLEFFVLIYENWKLQGMWAGMIFGGTALQTIILAFITYRCDWENEVISFSRKMQNSGTCFSILSKPFILTIKIIYCCAFLGRLKKLECMCKSGRSHLQLVNPRWSFPFLDNVESVTPSIFVLFPTLFLL